ncbi:mucin-2 isoform X2 [Patella vulgata]|uniref:mucin-2 isoform X2 n=1 Tax=Patella vulgata TaxID=6465 RepID=UPI0024A89A56|nr:mucin-2 isoform X2 [Patella vulgata]
MSGILRRLACVFLIIKFICVTGNIILEPNPWIQGYSANLTCETSQFATITKDSIEITTCFVSTDCSISPDPSTDYNLYYNVIATSNNVTINVANVSKVRDGGDWECQTSAGKFTITTNVTEPTTPTPMSTTPPDPTTIPIENTTVTQSSISQTSTSGATTSSDSSSSTPLSSSSLPSTSQQVTTNGASTTSNTPPPEDLSDEMLAVIIASSVVGFILLVVIIFFIVFCVVIRKRKRNPQKVQHPGDHSYSNKGYNYNRRPDMHSSESNQQSRHTPRQMNIADFQRQDHLHGPALTGSPHGHYPVYQLHNYPSKSEYKQSSRNKSSATKHNASSRRDPRSDKYRDPNKNYNYVDRNSDLNQEYYIRPYAGGYPLRSGDYRYYR